MNTWEVSPNVAFNEFRSAKHAVYGLLLGLNNVEGMQDTASELPQFYKFEFMEPSLLRH